MGLEKRGVEGYFGRMPLPLNPPWWRVVLANLIVIGMMAALWAGHYYLTWRFSLGGLVGLFLMYFGVRAKYGFWPFNEDD